MLLLCYSMLLLCDFFRFFATHERSKSLRYFANAYPVNAFACQFNSISLLLGGLLCLCASCLNFSLTYPCYSQATLGISMPWLIRSFPYLCFPLLCLNAASLISAIAYQYISVATRCPAVASLCDSYALLSIAVASLFNASPLQRLSDLFRFCPMQCRLIARLRFSYAKPIFSYATSSQVNLPWPELRH